MTLGRPINMQADVDEIIAKLFGFVGARFVCFGHCYFNRGASWDFICTLSQKADEIVFMSLALIGICLPAFVLGPLLLFFFQLN